MTANLDTTTVKAVRAQSFAQLINTALGDGLLLKQVNLPSGQVGNVAHDSRQVKADCIYVAIPGTHLDGRAYIDQAIANGARLVVADSQVPLPQHVGLAIVSNPRLALAKLGRYFYSLDELFSANELHLVGITGTNGKTTTSYFVQQILNQQGFTCGRIGTISYQLSADCQITAGNTTPQSLDLARYLRELYHCGARYVALEVSSHALDQQRTAALDFRLAVFTNLSGDHLDYHGSMEQYLQAKCLLFKQLDSNACSVVNADDPHAQQVIDASGARRVIRYSVKSPRVELYPSDVRFDAGGSEFLLHFQGRSVPVKLAALGMYNLSNALAAAGACLAMDVPIQQVAGGLGSLTCVPGRLERIAHNGDFQVLVDYAHTDDALDNVLGVLSPLAGGKLMVVFGCGGDRDRNKRPRMARVAQRWADKIFITNDNPRTEDPQQITDDILGGFDSKGLKKTSVIMDRAGAIRAAIDQAQPGDIVLIAGKGHEGYQIIGTDKIRFDDRQEACSALASRGLAQKLSS